MHVISGGESPASTTYQHPLPPQNSVTRRLAITTVSILLAMAGAWYLCRVALSAADEAGYDFRYNWLAGRLWLQGVSPYLPGYQEAGTALIVRGHVPELWVYPPNWWAISTTLGLTGLAEANVAWNLLGVGLAALSSVMLVRAFLRCRRGHVLALPVVGDVFDWGWALVLLHFFATAGLEATALTLAIGQTSLLVLFGVSLILYGASRARLPLAAAGLAVVLLKPQIGVVFLCVLPLAGPWARQLVLAGLGISAVLAVPAAVVDPSVAMQFVRNVTSNDGYTVANLPQAMTGVRLAVWELLGRDAGSIVAVAATVGAALLLARRSVRLAVDATPHVLVWQVVTLTVAVILAMAPLHYYDFVLVCTLAPSFLLARGVWLWAGLVGVALIVRADWLGKLTGYYDPGVPIFEGSILSSLGAALLLVAVLDAVRPDRPVAAASASVYGA